MLVTTTVAPAVAEARALHLPEATVCLALGVVTAVVRRGAPHRWMRVAATPVGATVATWIAVSAVARHALLPLAVALVAVAGGALGRSTGDGRQAGSVVVLANWLLGATIAWFVYLSTPDTEGAVAALALLVPLAGTETVVPRSVPAVQCGLEIGAVVGLVAGAALLGDLGAVSWTSWWLAKMAGVAVAAIALVVSPTGRGRRRPGPPPARRG